MKTKNIALSFGAISTVAIPVVATMSCGKKANKDLDVIKMDFSSDAKSAIAIKSFYDNIYKANQSSTEYKKYELDLTLPMGDYTIDLAPSEFAEVQQGKIDANSTEMSLADFAATMKGLTGNGHQFSYSKGDAVKLGLDNGDKKLSNLYVGVDQHDPAFQNKWLMDNLIKTMPTGVSISGVDVEKIRNNMKVTFTDGTTSEEVEFKLKSASNQAEADAENAKGGSMFYKAFKAIEEPIQKVIGEIKTIAHYGNVNNQISEKQVFTDVAKTVADIFVEKMGSMIPVYGEIINIPFVGDKVSEFVESHTIEPMIDFVANKL